MHPRRPVRRDLRPVDVALVDGRAAAVRVVHDPAVGAGLVDHALAEALRQPSWVGVRERDAAPDDNRQCDSCGEERTTHNRSSSTGLPQFPALTPLVQNAIRYSPAGRTRPWTSPRPGSPGPSTIPRFPSAPSCSGAPDAGRTRSAGSILMPGGK